MMRKSVLMAFAAPAALVAAPADAAIFAFGLTGANTASFTIDSAQLAPPAFSDGDTFIVDGVAGTFDGIARTAESITFNAASFDGGLTIQLGSAFLGFLGDQLFTGTTAAPAFRAGSFTLVSDADPAATVSLTISEVAAAIPEPASWAMMMAGFGIVGYAMRRRRTTVRLRAA